MKYSIKPLEWNTVDPGTGYWWAETPFGTLSVSSAGFKAALNGKRRECFVVSTKGRYLHPPQRQLRRNFRTPKEAMKAGQAMFEAQLSQWLEEAGS